MCCQDNSERDADYLPCGDFRFLFRSFTRANSQASLSGSSGIHIPFCENPSCEPFLHHAVDVLQKKGIPCVVEYEPGGLYQDRFQQAFDQTSCTILHVCPEILQQVERVASVLKKETGKAWFVRLEPRSSSNNTNSALLLEFHVKDLSTQEKRIKFLDGLLHRFGGSDSTSQAGDCPREQTPGVPERAASPQPPPPTPGPESGEEPDRFCPLPMVLRSEQLSQPSVNPSFFSLDPPHCSVETAPYDRELLAHKDIPIKDHAYFAHVVLLDLYKEGDLVSLATFACSPHFQFRLEALHFICELLLEKQSDFSRAMLLNTEVRLFKSLEQQAEEEKETCQETDYARKQINCAELLATVYLLLVSVCILRSGNGRENDTLCKNILQRPFFQMARTGSFTDTLRKRVGVTQTSPSYPEWLLAVKKCLRDWSTQYTCEKVRTRVNSVLLAQDRWHTVPSWSLPMKFTLLVECLGESFRTSKPVFLDFLKSFRPSKSGIKELGITLQRLITSLTIVGITTFLQRRSEMLSSAEHFQNLCSEMIDSLDVVVSSLDNVTQHKCFFLMTPLLFTMNKTVRQRTAFMLRQHLFYHEHMWAFLLLETILSFWPLLNARDLQLDSRTKIQQSWIVIPATFNGHQVLTHIHKPTTSEHLKHNRTEDGGAVQRDQYFTELGLLKELKHENVLNLVAFHDTYCPQVYVTEDYLATALQPVLVNRSRNSSHFPLKRLLNFVVEALRGLLYCHEKRIVHRDLTAANVYSTGGGKVKLAGFKHALKLSEKNVIRDFDLSFIATRWSAPESHRRCCFSLATDMWMAGHFLYEVMTHGRLPYADSRKPDEDLMFLVVDGKKRLCHERCIPKVIEDIIMELTVIREAERSIPVQSVISRLQRITASSGCPEDLRRFFPDLQSDDQIATKHAKGPILPLIDDFPGIEVPQEVQDEGDEEDAASRPYMNQIPKKGPVHFVKPCPESFTSEEWDILSQEDLPSITKLIGRPCLNSCGQRVLPFMVATSSSLLSLEVAVRDRLLGPDLRSYVQCMQQLATSIAYLHSRRIILCDFSPETIHVVQQSDYSDLQVWLTSLPQIKVLPESNELERHVDLRPPHDGEQCRRSAPEVLQHGQYSPASDVYCFGILLWWVFNTFEHHVYQSGELSPWDSVPVTEVYENVVSFQGPPISQCCPPHIAQLIRDCWNPNPHLRPLMKKLQRNLTLEVSQIASTKEDEGYEPIEVANASETGSTCTSDRRSSFSTTMSVDWGNPSELTDTDFQVEEIYVDNESYSLRCFDTETYYDQRAAEDGAVSNYDVPPNLNLPSQQGYMTGTVQKDQGRSLGTRDDGMNVNCSEVQKLIGKRDVSAEQNNKVDAPTPPPPNRSDIACSLPVALPKSCDRDGIYDWLPSNKSDIACSLSVALPKSHDGDGIYEDMPPCPRFYAGSQPEFESLLDSGDYETLPSLPRNSSAEVKKMPPPLPSRPPPKRPEFFNNKQKSVGETGTPPPRPPSVSKPPGLSQTAQDQQNPTGETGLPPPLPPARPRPPSQDKENFTGGAKPHYPPPAPPADQESSTRKAKPPRRLPPPPSPPPEKQNFTDETESPRHLPLPPLPGKQNFTGGTKPPHRRPPPPPDQQNFTGGTEPPHRPPPRPPDQQNFTSGTEPPRRRPPPPPDQQNFTGGTEPPHSCFPPVSSILVCSPMDKQNTGEIHQLHLSPPPPNLSDSPPDQDNTGETHAPHLPSPKPESWPDQQNPDETQSLGDVPVCSKPPCPPPVPPDQQTTGETQQHCLPLSPPPGVPQSPPDQQNTDQQDMGEVGPPEFPPSSTSPGPSQNPSDKQDSSGGMQAPSATPNSQTGDQSQESGQSPSIPPPPTAVMSASAMAGNQKETWSRSEGDKKGSDGNGEVFV